MIRIISFKNTIYFLCSIIVCLFLSCNNEMETTPTVEYKYMSVNLNDVDYEKLINAPKRLGTADWPFTMVESNHNNGVKYIWLQGAHNEFQINIRIPENFWEEGTFTLEEGNLADESSCWVTLVNLSTDPDFDLEGEITITKFDIENKIFEGSFNFSSPNNTATGTLDYPLDHEEFN